VLVAAAFAGTAGTALADDSSLARFGGEGYVFFHQDRLPASSAPSAFRQQNRNGLSVSEYQELSSSGPAWHPAPTIDKTPATYRQTNPHGLAFGEYQALSSNSAMWMPGRPSSGMAGELTSPRLVPKSASR